MGHQYSPRTLSIQPTYEALLRGIQGAEEGRGLSKDLDDDGTCHHRRIGEDACL